jgi:hypothetical protein
MGQTLKRGRRRGIFTACLAALALQTLPCPVSAHRLDEYLQATLVSIGPEGIRLRINLTPGVEVAEAVIASVDRDHDGIISPQEAAAYVEMLKGNLVATLDQRVLELTAGPVSFPTPADLRSGWGIIQVELAGSSGVLAGSGTHRFSLENRQRLQQFVYLFNAAAPKSRAVRILQQSRNETQSVGAIEFTLDDTRSLFSKPGFVAAALALFVLLAWALRRAVNPR